ncbi:MAG: PDZ domain-containing protein [Deltaproteobacteria bacterium]|nr:PDZ domain-containing protein [Deltaproteobacteria bacterium]
MSLRRFGVWVGLIGACILSFLFGLGAVRGAYAAGRSSYGALGVFGRALSTIEERHVDGPSAEALLAAAINGMVGSLDPHSAFLPPAARAAQAAATEGELDGVGLELRRADGPLVVDRVVEGGPADKAGVSEGAVLLDIDGEAPTSRAQAQAALGGARGAPVRLRLRGVDGAVAEISVVRDTFIDIPVQAEREGDVLYLRVDRFTRGVAGRVQALVDAAAAERPLTGIVLDLRDNPGGLMDEAGRLVDLFCGDGLVVETRDRGGAAIDRYEARSSPDDRSEPLVVIVDGDSASAAELTAGALRGLGRATVVGEQTWGKASVQHLFAFDDGGAIKLTVARYHLPGGEQVGDRVGLRPTPEVSRGRRLRGQLARVEAEAKRAAPNDKALLGAIRAAATEDDWERAPIPRGGDLATRRQADPQLEAAWQALRGPGR